MSIDYEFVIARRESEASLKQQSLESRLKALQERLIAGSDWLDANSQHPDYQRQKQRWERLAEIEGKLFTVMQQFRFPMAHTWWALPEGLAWGNGRTEMRVVQDLRAYVPDVSGAELEGVWLAADARFLLAEALELL